MHTSRTSAPIAFLLAVLGVVGASGCAADAEENVADQQGAMGASPAAAGITSGSLEEEGVLLLANDRSVTEATFVSRANLTSAEAQAIVAGRTGSDGKPRWYRSIDELDAQPSIDDNAFGKLLADARAQGYVEAPGFDPPTQARMTVPSGLGRPPTAADVSVEAGFDGKTPTEVLALVRSRLMNTVDRSNDRFVDQTITTLHKNFTIAVGNFYAQNSPHAAFARSLRALGAEKLTLLGTMSSVHPTILLSEAPSGTKTYWTRGSSGRYESLPVVPKYPVVMRARLRIDGPQGQGVRLFYPAWSAKALTGPTTVIIEGS